MPQQNNKPPKKNKSSTPRVAASRWGIAEWYGKDISKLSPTERQEFGKIASGTSTGSAPLCPFLSTLRPGSLCNKSGGVCSIRKVRPTGDGSAEVLSDKKIATVCPSRFLQHVAPNKSLFVWIAEKMLDISNPTVVKETPFLRKVSNPKRPQEIEDEMDEEAKDEQKKAGRIDWIIVNPDTVSGDKLEWCAIETQAVYFSGKKMGHEFEAYAEKPAPVLFPIMSRRPDYRSSGPKRLSPQLDVKVPVLGRWGKKVAIVIDRFFHENMNILEDAYGKSKNEQEKRDNAEVVWFVVDFDNELNLKTDTVIYTTLDSSRKALNATEPLSMPDFNKGLKQVIADSPANKVFKT